VRSGGSGGNGRISGPGSNGGGRGCGGLLRNRGRPRRGGGRGLGGGSG
jgi:hypothetical protein